MSSSEKRRRVLGVDALDGLVPAEVPLSAVPVPAAVAVHAPVAVSAPVRVESRMESREEAVTVKARSMQPKVVNATRSKITFSLPDELLDECRNAVDYLSGPPTRLTLAALVERALRRELASLRGKHCEGNAFPSREGPLRTGRPLRG